MDYFKTNDLAVGYNRKILIHDIDVSIERGKILTLIGPNGAGKSTILKTITRHLEKIAGTVVIGKHDVHQWSAKEMARQVAVVLTDRIRPELMTCREVVAMGRYPYTNVLGKLTEADKACVQAALERVHALDIEEQDFTTLSDGQRQRVLLARAICQDPEVLVLDEPTAYLDIRHKIELLDILREMARDKSVTVVMSLHEIDLAAKISDYLLCVKGDTIAAFGDPEEILTDTVIGQLYDIRHGSYDSLFGSVELTKPSGDPKVFVVGGGGYGIPCYRALQKRQVPFATGVLFENDLDTPVARQLSENVITAPAFAPIPERAAARAAALVQQCGVVLDAGTPVGTFNSPNQALLDLAASRRFPIYHGWKEWAADNRSSLG